MASVGHTNLPSTDDGSCSESANEVESTIGIWVARPMQTTRTVVDTSCDGLNPDCGMSLRDLLSGERTIDRVLRESEMALTDPDVRSSRARLEELLHPEFVETSSSGEVYDRETIIEMMTTEAPGEVLIRDFTATSLADDVALTTYRSIGTAGQEARRTSIWVLERGRWRLRHHQGTRVVDRWGRVS